MPDLTFVKWEPQTALYQHDWNPEEDSEFYEFERRWCFIHPDGTWTEFFTVDGNVAYHLHVYDGA